MSFRYTEQDFATPEHPKIVPDVLHEFGHALSLDHEHQHPACDIQWDVNAVLAEYQRLGWDATKTRFNILDRITDNQIYLRKPYDPVSVMHYPFRESLLQP